MTNYRRINHQNHVNSVVYLNRYKKKPKSKYKSCSLYFYAQSDFLIGLYNKRRQSEEFKTTQAVERCRQRISLTVDSFLEQKRRLIPGVVKSTILANDLIFDYSALIAAEDLNKLIIAINHLILDELEIRFKLNKDHLIPVTACRPADYFPLINEWLVLKKRALKIAGGTRVIGGMALDLACGRILSNNFLKYFIEFSDLNSLVLSALGFNSQLSLSRLQAETTDRLEAALQTLSSRLWHEFQSLAAKIIYSTHDAYIDNRLENKIRPLKQNKQYPCHLRQEACAR